MARERDRHRGHPLASADDILWADAVLFGTPTRFGNDIARAAAGVQARRVVTIARALRDGLAGD